MSRMVVGGGLRRIGTVKSFCYYHLTQEHHGIRRLPVFALGPTLFDSPIDFQSSLNVLRYALAVTGP
jgi:hypothetical protein